MVASLKGDVYALGVVLLELATGQRPLEISNAEEGFKGNLVDWPKDRWPMYKVSESLESIAEKQGFSERYDEFPLLFGRQDTDNLV
ncbi:hypothetical protein F0562_004704 [Nyssa sinensis]|uniref:Serine-threonine/tyrosine-protein kinase catalytic domain-containing protein n=1 Tax=Nyssa sinensis TaxID=561372 RepID=A0A5J5BY64_9ASTE|nr:hypothetical protein F0562_004704 [Nyssa sinensis]